MKQGKTNSFSIMIHTIFEKKLVELSKKYLKSRLLEIGCSEKYSKPQKRK